jgi:hypothetical protein
MVPCFLWNTLYLVRIYGTVLENSACLAILAESPLLYIIPFSYLPHCKSALEIATLTGK